MREREVCRVWGREGGEVRGWADGGREGGAVCRGGFEGLGGRSGKRRT